MRTKNDAIKSEIEKQMMQTYLLYCLPRMTISTQSGEQNLEYVWVNKDAEKAYKGFGEVLASLYAQEKRATRMNEPGSKYKEQAEFLQKFYDFHEEHPNIAVLPDDERERIETLLDELFGEESDE